MQAAVLDAFGEPETLRFADVERPLVGPDQVLVKTRAAGVNPVDLKTIRGRLAQRYPHHFPLTPGWDVAGTVEAAGPAVTRFVPGDRVVAYARKSCIEHGTYAEYVSVPEESVTKAPESVDLATAAALPLAALTALQAIQSVNVSSGETVLVHGGSGGVGSFAVQLLKDMEVDVLATSGPASHEFLRSLGAEAVDRKGDVAAQVRSIRPAGVDVALDLAGGPEAVELSLPLLRDGGRIASLLTVPEIPEGDASRGVWGRYTFVRPYGDQLAELVARVDSQRLEIHVHRAFELQEAAEALRTLEAGGLRGKLILRVER